MPLPENCAAPGICILLNDRPGLGKMLTTELKELGQDAQDLLIQDQGKVDICLRVSRRECELGPRSEKTQDDIRRILEVREKYRWLLSPEDNSYLSD